MKESMKKSALKLFCTAMAMGICLSSAASQAAFAASIELPVDIVIDDTVGESSGECGVSAKWSLQNGTLTITGTGNITDWENVSYAPWYPKLNEIRNVVISEGITNVGRASFLGATNLTSVTIPSTATSISAAAFQRTNLSSVTIPANVTTVGDKAFFNCQNLREVKVYSPNCKFVNPAACITNNGSFNGTIMGADGSTAQQLAKSLNCNFVILQDIPRVTTTVATTTVTAATTKATSKPTTTTTTTTTTTATTTQNPWNWNWEWWNQTTTTTTTQNPWNWEWWNQTTTTTQPQQPQPQQPPQPHEPAQIMFGDANCDNEVSIADSVLIMQSISNPSKFDLRGSDPSHITEHGKECADVHQRGNGITNSDALSIQKYKLGLLMSLPE